LVFILASSKSALVGRAAQVDFDRDIRPILSGKCFQCHGPDEEARQADLRLDDRTSLFADRQPATIVPYKTGDSELIRRITSDDPDIQMPPPESPKDLTESEINLIKAWIEQGANWKQHWSYVVPQRPRLPRVDDSISPRNEIDLFVMRRLADEGLSLSRSAEKVVLIRRLYSDLLGMPPAWDDVSEFARSDDDSDYLRLVDRLLASPHFGERMAMYWLDVVRYADSNGYHSDEPRAISPYRDWVIGAFNSDKPFDQFVVEQLAGDLIPGASIEQKVASGFNMLLQTTNEGGAQAKEYLAKYAADRVRNTSAIFMGSTMGCAECHDHKYDPFTTRDFYQFAAFFADIQEKGVGNPIAYPVIYPEDQRRLDDFDRQIQQFESQMAQSSAPAELAAEQTAWEQEFIAKKLPAIPRWEDWHAIGPFATDNGNAAFETSYPPESKVELDRTYGQVGWRRAPEFTDGQTHSLGTQRGATYLVREIQSTAEFNLEASFGSDDAIKVWLNGELVITHNARRAVAADQEQAILKLQPGTNQLLVKIVNDGGQAGFYFDARPFGVPSSLLKIVSQSPDRRSAEEIKRLADYFPTISPTLKKLKRQVENVRARRQQFLDRLAKTLMTVSTSPRVTRVLPRGNWMDDSGEALLPDVPRFLGPLQKVSGRPTRLDLARWIVDRQNPLTARTFVNRLWKLFFGQGLATPLDDLGSQGNRPMHPELLDWLAVEFMESGWDVKHIVRLMVTSAVYQQTSDATLELRQHDPYNRLLARQSRFRLDAEMVRDNALAISGLLVRRIGGESVKPYQPDGYWRHMNFPIRTWQNDGGANQFRRGMYTWWQRMFLHPSLLAFDAPSREECTVERPRSNTPQQALVLLNDPTYVEAARVFAQRVIEEGGTSVEDRIDWAYLRALSRNATAFEKSELTRLYEGFLADYQAQPDAASKLVATGIYPVSSKCNVVELAAWTSVTRVILNLHETVTRR
jgi:hypothetical protein